MEKEEPYATQEEYNERVVKSSFSNLLATYSQAQESEVVENAEMLYKRSIDQNSHPVHAVDALEAILPTLMM